MKRAYAASKYARPFEQYCPGRTFPKRPNRFFKEPRRTIWNF